MYSIQRLKLRGNQDFYTDCRLNVAFLCLYLIELRKSILVQVSFRISFSQLSGSDALNTANTPETGYLGRMIFAHTACNTV